ncbi:MAG: PD-(D/E)XK nuclease family protein, partial [Planctomycetota bacterium]
GRARGRRIRALVEVLRFTRDAAGRLPPPGDLAAFWAHYQRLDEDEQAFRFRADEDAEPASADDEGVRLITAHQSKGLEFDTVFIPKIGPSTGGFGWLKPDDPPALPGELTGEPDLDRRDEVRRLFYVAMTRAQRRLVLLAKRSKSRSRSVHFLHELIWPGKTPLPGGSRDGPMLMREEADVLAGLSSSDPIAAAAEGRVSLGRRASRVRRQARLRAAQALDSVENPGVTADEVHRAAEILRASAETLAGVAALERGGSPPSWIGSDVGASLEGLDDADGADEGASAWPGLKPPLELSYSRLDRYTRCPACFYLEHVLGLTEPPTHSLMLGNAAHLALERFYRAWTAADNEGGAPPGRADLLALGREAYFEQVSGEADRAALERVLAQLGAGFDALHRDEDEIMMIEENVTFGYKRESGDDPRPHRFRAKLDRVDRIGSGFRIIDYKTGAAAKRLTEPATDDLQLGVYAMALAHQLEIEPEALTGEACYWLLGAQRVGTLPLEAIDWPKVRRGIDRAVTGMLEGFFPRGSGCGGRCRLLLPPGGDGVEAAAGP